MSTTLPFHALQRGKKMNAPSPVNWSEFDVERLTSGDGNPPPIVTEDSRTLSESGAHRVEISRIRNTALDEAAESVRVVSASDAQYDSVVVPELLDGRLLLVCRYRHAAQRWSLEFPRFAGETSDEGWLHAAAQSLRQDVGLAAAGYMLLGGFQPDVTMQATNTIVVLATGCEPQVLPANDTRTLIMGAVGVAPSEIGQLVQRGGITCGVSLAALALYLAQKRP
jgi:hypothetical protein